MDKNKIEERIKIIDSEIENHKSHIKMLVGGKEELKLLLSTLENNHHSPFCHDVGDECDFKAGGTD